jgi:hypothetical protein
MNEQLEKIQNIFYPEIIRRRLEAREQNLKFVQYTSAEAATSIINGKKVWLRNVQCMNDFSEIEHGRDCLVSAYQHEKEGKDFRALIETLFPGISHDFESRFDAWLPFFRSSTYILCVSEHSVEEEKYGRLSMWRAYGGENPVALVINPKTFSQDSDALKAYTFPVIYSDKENFKDQLSALRTRIEDEKDFILSLGQDEFSRWLFDVFRFYVLCTKHPGFAEEREWRVVYNPLYAESANVLPTIEVVGGVPQKVQSIPLENIPRDNLSYMTVPELIERIIIGPNDHQSVLEETFINLLEEAGCENARDKVHSSGIPLR